MKLTVKDEKKVSKYFILENFRFEINVDKNYSGCERFILA